MNDKGYSLLENHLASKVWVLAIEDKPINEIKKEDDTIGISVVPGFDEDGTAIIIDAIAQKYQLSDAELSSASTFFVTLVQIVDYASQIIGYANNASQEVKEKV